AWKHQANGVRGCHERRADARVEHAVPSMHRLFPKRRAPREGAVFDHLLVSAPGGVHQDIERAGLGHNALEGGGSVSVARVIACDPHDVRWKIGRGDSTAGCINTISK